MQSSDRRQFLLDLLGKLAQTAGTFVIGSATVSLAQAQEQPAKNPEGAVGNLQERADRLVALGNQPAAEANEFLNGVFRNTPLGGFGNAPLGGFRNTPLGGFRNTPLGGFRNTPLGGFNNTPLGGFNNTPLGGFRNYGWPNGGWGGFRNGGWSNVGWRNWWG